MNKKYLFLIVVLLGLAVLVAGCNSRDLSKPSTRLVGHWAYWKPGDFSIYAEDSKAPTYESYFGEDGIGSYAMVSPSETVYAQYRVLSERGDLVTISVFVGTESSAIKQEIYVTENNLTYRDAFHQSYDYINSKTSP
jgi:hypothetical protein